jgi:hydrogenase maturation protease
VQTLVLGLGNPILGDDGVGWHVAEQVRRRLATSPEDRSASVEVECAAQAGLGLMERMIGYDRAILVDAVRTGRWPVGAVHRLALEEIPEPCAGHLASAHDASLQAALALGRRLGAALPARITVVAVEARTVHEFSVGLTPAVADAVPKAADMVLATLRELPEPA